MTEDLDRTASATADCNRAEALLPDYWQDALAAGDHAWLQRHLEGCTGCTELAAIWRDLGALPEAEPGPLQRTRFDAMLESYRRGMQDAAPAAARRRWLPSMPLRWSNFAPGFAGQPASAMAALVLLCVGVGAGWLLRGAGGAPNNEQLQQTHEIAALRDEVESTRQLAVLSLLQQQSASDRLQGVSYSTQMPQADPQVITALMHSLEYDSNADVRLAALDALQRTAARSGPGNPMATQVRSDLLEAFSYQHSPLVQAAMVDSFVELRDTQARVLLQQVQHNNDYEPEVRQHAAWGLAQWQ